MSLHHSPRSVTANLLLNLDFKNPKVFDSVGTNLVTHPNYNPATWTNTFSGIKQTNIDAPDGTKTAVRLSGIVRTGTYTVTSNIATITIPNHELSGGSHFFDFTSGTAPDGFYVVSVVDTNTITIPITTSNTSGNVRAQYRSGQRINLTPFTPNGTDRYTLSFWARLISLGDYGTGFNADLADGSPTDNFVSQLVLNNWTQVVVSGVPTNTSKSFLDLISDFTSNFIIDLWGVKLENQTTDTSFTTVKSNIDSPTFNLHRPEFARQSIDDVTFTRTSSAPKWGGRLAVTATGALTSTNFLYNDHTWEVWFKINDVTPGDYGDSAEQFSTLALYAGFHAGYFYTATSLRYSMWDQTGSTNVTACSWTVGTSGANINQGQWYQIAVTRLGNVFTPYINGIPLGVGSDRSYTAFSNVSNSLCLGAAFKNLPGGGSFNYYAKNTISNMKMYNRALTAQEIQQNFNALRGRYGL
jgi:hypothetical protein